MTRREQYIINCPTLELKLIGFLLLFSSQENELFNK